VSAPVGQWPSILLFATQVQGDLLKLSTINTHSPMSNSADDYPLFDVHRTVHRNIISIVKLKRCGNVSNLFYFGMTLYTLQTVLPSIIGSARLYIQQQAFVKLQIRRKIKLLVHVYIRG